MRQSYPDLEVFKKVSKSKVKNKTNYLINLENDNDVRELTHWHWLFHFQIISLKIFLPFPLLGFLRIVIVKVKASQLYSWHKITKILVNCMITFIFIILITSKKIIFMLTQTSLLFSSVIFNIFAIFIRKQKIRNLVLKQI